MQEKCEKMQIFEGKWEKIQDKISGDGRRWDVGIKFRRNGQNYEKYRQMRRPEYHSGQWTM